MFYCQHFWGSRKRWRSVLLQAFAHLLMLCRFLRRPPWCFFSLTPEGFCHHSDSLQWKWFSIYPRSSLFNTISFFNDVLATAFNTLLACFRLPHFSRPNYLACLAHLCRSVGNSLIYSDLVSILFTSNIFLYTSFSVNGEQGPEALILFINS